MNKLPPRPILQGLRVADVSVQEIALWYNCSESYVYWSLRFGRSDWCTEPKRNRFTGKPVSYPPERVLSYWREHSMSPGEMSIVCENIYKEFRGS